MGGYVEDDYKKQQEALKEALAKVAKKAKTKVATSIATEMELKDSMKCKMAYKVFDEAIDMYEDGTLTWDEMVEDITKTLKVIGSMKD
jgi:hypothetical protein